MLPLRPLVVKTGLEDAGPADDPAPGSRAGRIRRLLRGLVAFSVPRIIKTTGDVDEDVHGRVMRYLLAGYRRTVASGFTSIRLEGRLHLDGRPAAAIHTHELYWADLSKSSANPLATALEMLKLPLLQHLEAWRDSRGRGYDLIVFVAHSQGSVLVADILRFLRADRFRALDGGERAEFRVPLALVTPGSPLKQIYAEAFPQSCDGVRGGGDTRRLLEDLGVREWLNVYRSGDYVGRELWSGRYECAAAPAGNPGEVCLGAGAHTRYFESPRVAEIVDEVIARHLPPPAAPVVPASGVRVVARPAESPDRT